LITLVYSWEREEEGKQLIKKIGGASSLSCFGLFPKPFNRIMGRKWGVKDEVLVGLKSGIRTHGFIH
jgi:hypothetical protein